MTGIADEQVRMVQLMEDPIFANWVDKVPDLGATMVYGGQPWTLWVRHDMPGPWGFRKFRNYIKGYKWLNIMLDRDVWDVALVSNVKPFKPPVVRDKSLGLVRHAGSMVGKKRYHVPSVVGMHAKHHWCPYCRRPTIFTNFAKHHAFLNHARKPLVGDRCAVCGFRLESLALNKELYQ